MDKAARQTAMLRANLVKRGWEAGADGSVTFSNLKIVFSATGWSMEKDGTEVASSIQLLKWPRFVMRRPRLVPRFPQLPSAECLPPTNPAKVPPRRAATANGISPNGKRPKGSPVQRVNFNSVEWGSL